MILSEKTGSRLFVALLHYPVLNRKGEIIVSAVTNLDIHDIARSSITFGVETCFFITPSSSQQDLLARLVRHWQSGPGGELNPHRKQALNRVETSDSLEAVIRRVKNSCGMEPEVYVTSARHRPGCMTWCEARRRFREGGGVPKILAFGTAHGLAPRVLEQAHAVLEPIQGVESYNHLSVRSAVAITLDRLIAGGR